MELAPLDYSGAAGAVISPSAAALGGFVLPMNVPACNDGGAVAIINNKQEVQVSRIINFTFFFLMSAVIVGIVFVGLPSYGVFGDEYLWMQYQTLVTPATFINLIWIPIIVLHGLFIYASCCHTKLKVSPLVGYDERAVALTFHDDGRNNNNSNNNNNIEHTIATKVLLIILNKQQQYSIALIQYPALCIFTIAMIYSHDYGYMALALFFSLTCGNILYNILLQQRSLLSNQSGHRRKQQQGQQQQRQQQQQGHQESNMLDSKEEEHEEETDFYFDDFSLAGQNNNSVDATAILSDSDGDGGSKVLQYMAVRLPFELYAGYILSSCTVYLNAAIISNISMMPTWVYLVIANTCLIGLLIVGYTLLWRGRVYGTGISLIWYLGGVFAELHEPSQPVYNEFADNSIFATYIISGLVTLALTSIVGIRIVKTLIKHGRCGGGGCGDDTPTSIMNCSTTPWRTHRSSSSNKKGSGGTTGRSSVDINDDIDDEVVVVDSFVTPYVQTNNDGVFC